MEEIGVVKNIAEGKVEVEIDPSNACGQCANKSACHLEEGENKRTLIVSSDKRVQLGDLVQIESEMKNAILSAFLIFIFPLIFLGLGYVLGSQKSEGWGILAALIGLLTGLLLLRLIDSYFGRKKSFQPRITKILENCPLPAKE